MIDEDIYYKIESNNIQLIDKFGLIQREIEYGICKETIMSLVCTLIISSKKTALDVKKWAKVNLVKVIYEEVDILYRIICLKQLPADIRYKVVNQKSWLNKDYLEFVKLSLDPKRHSIKLTSILVLIKKFGLRDIDIEELSIHMSNSGKQYNYLEAKELSGKLLLRRYPTGGVSEKTALIMPSLLKCLSRNFNIASPFLVAKTLSFTGGTWDKLRCIPGFTFPLPGEESIEKLKKESVCMTVTNGDYNPSDKNLYQLRSITNTVDSLPLIVVSIASKQLANPVHQLLLDIRYGKNAFIKSKNQATLFFDKTNAILEKNHIHTIAEYTDSNLITGSAIGNYLEVLEAICLMKNETNYSTFKFNREKIEIQKKLIVKFTSRIISSCQNVSMRNIELICEQHFLKGEVFESFIELISDHGVSKKHIHLIQNNVDFAEGKHLSQYQIKAGKSGTVDSINTRKIGEYVNFHLNAGTNIFSNSKNYYNGVLLNKHVNQAVKEGDVLATIYSQKRIEIIDLDQTFFKIC